ncbi:Cell division cycle protein [Fasciolopsis buskii]|uniref:Cell division cycle protein n=1 Tax=Fasciolopsis buskii TaxID=27845 RepID=A0A8E0RJ16_9TREM|nr:Cell division cycle protein [Fasciolopsis buski]
MRIEDVRQCSFDTWYPEFRTVSVESYVPNKTNHDSSSSDSGPEFPEFESKLSEAIDQLGGVVFPKLNWSCPKDAAWMLCGNSLKCRTFSDIYLLLKSSDFTAHDLYCPYLLCSDAPLPNEQSSDITEFKLKLVLRRWTDIQPDGEFRCFVRGHKLVAISQRIYDAYFSSIIDDEERIVQELGTFFLEHIRDRFPLAEYTFDVYRESSVGCAFYFTRHVCPKGHTILIDFNVFGPPTEPLLFSWDELENMDPTPEDRSPIFKCQRDSSIRPSVFQQYQYPVEMTELWSVTDPGKMIDLIQEVSHACFIS